MGGTFSVFLRKYGYGSYQEIEDKIEDDPQKPEMIQTVWGKGYRFGENQ